MERWYSHEYWNFDYRNRGRRCRHSFHTFFDDQFSCRHPLENLPQNTLFHSHNQIKLPSSKITASNFALQNGIEFALSQKILQELVKSELLMYTFGIRCPECGLLLSSTESIASIEKEQYCYNCGEEIEISPDDIEVIYTFKITLLHMGSRVISHLR